MSVVFASDHDIERAENISAVWRAYSGPRDYVRGVSALPDAIGHDAIVVDTLFPYLPNKDCPVVFVGHGMYGGKRFALHEGRPGIDPRALAQIDWAVCSSRAAIPDTAAMLGIPAERVLPLGMPRTDAYIGKAKGDGGTFLAHKTAYFYAPTYHRPPHDGEHLPRIDWARLDALLDDDEIFAVKRHYFDPAPIVAGRHRHIMELDPFEPSARLLIDCDVIVTDYSSILFDAYLIGKPSVLLTDDMEEYMRTRGMYLPYPEGYGSRWLVAEGNEDKLVEHMRAACVTGMRRNERRCSEISGDMCDGHSAQRVAEFIRRVACASC